MFFPEVVAPIEALNQDLFEGENIKLYVLREDMLDPFVSGNKFRKLKYNLLEAQKQQKTCLLTFGGAYSNHIAAVAAAGKEMGFSTIGIIRGEELISFPRNPTLEFATSRGMHLHFVSRTDYRKRQDPDYMEVLRKKFGDYYLIPEGGTNELAVKGCEEILSERTVSYDYICAPVGTGGTLAGLIKAALPHQHVIGFSALKGTFQETEIMKYTPKTNFSILDTYCFGGYGKIDVGLIRFINEFKKKTQIPLDPIYTGKMMFGVNDLLNRGYFKSGTRILTIHTGGLQGIKGMNEKLIRKNLPQIE